MKTVSDKDGAETKEEANWMPLIVFIQSKGNMRRDEILAAPLFLLNSVHKELLEIWQQEMTMRLNSGLAGLMGGGATTEQPKADPRMGTMPQPKSRDEYFAMMGNLRG